MIVIYDKKTLCNAPDVMSIGDTLLVNNKAYHIFSKTWDNDNEEIYCKVQLIDEKKNIHEILTEIYENHHFVTSGFNTNAVSSNPRILILMAICTTIIDDDYMKSKGNMYKDLIIKQWNYKKILWEDIFTDNPPIKNDDLKSIAKNSAALLKMSKVADNLWPEFIQKAYRQS